MDEITALSAKRIVERIKARDLSAVEVATAFLRRIEKFNPQLNAIATLSPTLLDQALAADATLQKVDRVGPLHGLPITIKDTIETAGLLSTSGSKMRAHFVPERDAPAVASLKAAGAIILGKTNPAEMAMDYTGDNPMFGRTQNPHNPSLTPGGSSAGEAVALATCMSPAGVGSDLAGSIRIPAHFCGIAGLKPSTQTIPGAGQFPPSIGPYSLGAALGPMARYVEDLQLLFDVLADRTNSPSDALRGCKFAWYTDDGVASVNADTRSAVKTAAAALVNAGLVGEERLPPGIERGHDLWLKIFSRASVVQLRKVYAGHEEDGGDFVRWRLATADSTQPPTLDEYITSWMERDRLREELLRWMIDVPLLLAPVGASPAFPHDTLKINANGTAIGVFKAFSYSQTFNVFDLPAVCVPAGKTSEGLPIGVQIAGRPFAESQLLSAARVVEQSLGGWQMPPGI